MLYYFLYEILKINLFYYQTVRAGLGFFISFVICVFAMPFFIKWMKKNQFSQPIYDLAPEAHRAEKKNIPTMGGVIFIASTFIGIILAAKLDNIYVVIGALVLMMFFGIGFVDDAMKISNKSNKAGLSAKMKFALQCVVGLVASLLLYNFSNLNTYFHLPFYKYSVFDMGVFAIAFWTLIMVSASNAVNLTDGLDGLATVPSIFSLATLGIFAYVFGNSIYSKHLLLTYFDGVGELTVVACALMGALVGFLWYNCQPAEIYMGDTGSLSVGGFLGYMGVVTKNEILLFIIGFVFVLETVSVILQVGSYKMIKKRLFLMAPVHHHFEKKGWRESKITVRFWMIALLANLIALTALKLR